MRSPRLDAHHHFWKYSKAEYGWIRDDMKPLQRSFLPPDLAREIRAAGIDGVISVQARQTVEETRWLLEMAANHAFIRGVVGWLPLIDRSLPEALARFAGQKKLKAVRHVLQDEADDAYMLRDDFNAGIRTIETAGLVYDILIFERHLANAIRFVDRHPQLVFVVDHIAKPRIKDRTLSPWRENLKELAKRPHLYCKLSGMVTEADLARWTEADLAPYFDAALEAFGPQRLMFGSDWPVCLLGTGYQRWVDTVSHALARLSESERERIWGGTAVEAYGLNA